MLWELPRRSRASAVWAFTVLLAIGSPASADGQPPHPLGQTIRDVTYCRDAGVPQKLDLLYPKIKVTFPRPVILWVHGGTWVTGSKDDASSLIYVEALRRAGYIVAAMNYALAPQHPFPSQTQDLTCGIRFLRSTAAKYGLDAAHVGAMGGSAGGHLVQMLGVNNGASAFQGGGYPNYSSAVQAVVSLWGVSDLNQRDLGAADERRLPSIFGAYKRWKWAKASPITYVRGGLPPFLFVHGKDDTDVPASQSRRMYRALVNDKVPATLVMVDHADHGLKPAGGAVSPSVSNVASHVVTFFKWAFKRTT